MANQKTLSSRPLVVVCRGFLSKPEVSHVLEMVSDRWKPSTVVDSVTGRDAIHEDRTGYLADFRDAEDSVVAKVEKRIADWTKTRVKQGETLQAIRYGKSHQYKAHVDWFDPKVPAHAMHLAYGGQRSHTAIVCLQAAKKGGETEFPKLGVKVLLKAGDALYWQNTLDGGQHTDMAMHSGCPVLSGEKIILSRWIRERAADGSEETKGPAARQRIYTEIAAILTKYGARMDPQLSTTNGPDGSVSIKPIIHLTLPEDIRGKR